MALKPEMSLMTGLATATVVYGIYSAALPPVADVRTVEPNQPDVDAAEKTAAWMSAGVVAGISLLAKDMTVFVIGAGMVIALSWWNKHSSMVIPELHAAVPRFAGEADQISADNMGGGEVYDYSQAATG
jgi:hypothetical protein